MSDVSRAPPVGHDRLLPVAGGSIGQVVNPPPHLPRLVVPGSVISAVVIGSDGRGRLRLESDHGQLLVQTNLMLPKGTSVSLHFRAIGAEVHVLILADKGRAAARGATAPSPTAQVAPDAAAGSPSSSQVAPASFSAGRWSSLEALVQALAQDRGSKREIARPDALPRPGPHLAIAWLALFRALRQDRPREWLERVLLGDQGASARREELLADLSRFLRLAAEPDEEGWRHFALPLLLGARAELFWLRLRGGSQTGDATSGTRFQVSLQFSELGPLQIDGLLHHRRLNLILRSREDLPPQLQADLEDICHEAADLLGMSGQLAFQVDQVWQPSPPPAAALGDGSVVV